MVVTKQWLTSPRFKATHFLKKVELLSAMGQQKLPEGNLYMSADSRNSFARNLPVW